MQIDSILQTGLIQSTPLIFAAEGETFNELSGVANVGIEGVMLAGALAGAIVLAHGGGFVLGALAGIGTGVVLGLVLSWLYIVRYVDQIVGGILFNLTLLGLTTILYSRYLNQTGNVPTIGNTPIPLLSRIPLLGATLFDQTALAYIVLLAALSVFWVLRYTWFGTYLRAAGQNPETLEICGVSVTRIRTISLTGASALAGLGGASIILISSGSLVPDITSGNGYIAVAIVMLSGWNPIVVVFGGWLFGFAEAIQYQVQALGALRSVPNALWQMLPFLVGLVTIMFARSKSIPPALGVPYVRDESTRRVAPRWLGARLLSRGDGTSDARETLTVAAAEGS